jgi:hypothetical protein
MVLLGTAQYAAFVELVTGAQALPHSRRERARRIVELVLPGQSGRG